MSDDIPILDINAEDKEAEALRYADAVAAWQAKRRISLEHPVSLAEVEALADEPERLFEWPCDRRDAHHPHPEDGCPGVGAHPATQIGGNYKEGEY